MTTVKRFLEDDYNACLVWLALSVLGAILLSFW